MRLVALGCVLTFLSAFTTEARRVSAGISFTATLQSDATGSAATMSWTTNSGCTQGLILSGRPKFICAGRWRCEGDACPGRRGNLEFTFDPDGFHDVLLRVSRQSVCNARLVGIWPQGHRRRPTTGPTSAPGFTPSRRSTPARLWSRCSPNDV